MTQAPHGTPVPFAITKWAAANSRRVDKIVWRSDVGAITARLVSDDAVNVFAKWSPHDLLSEAERLSWLSSRYPSPRMADFEELDDGWLIVTIALAGESAASERWNDDPDVAAAAVGEGLARLHTLDPSDCPFEAPSWVAEHDDIDLLVVTHGNATASNTLVDARGQFIGAVGVGELGVADRWADLSIASWSVASHFGPGHDAAFWAAYGETPDPDRIRRYRTAWGKPGD